MCQRLASSLMIWRTRAGLGRSQGRKRRRTTLRRGGTLVSTFATWAGGGLPDGVVIHDGVTDDPPAGAARATEVVSIPIPGLGAAMGIHPPRALTRVFTGT